MGIGRKSTGQLAIIFFFAGIAFSQTVSTIDWKTFDENWAAFLAAPSDDLMSKLLNLIPPGGRVADINDPGVAVIQKVAEGIGLLETQAYEKNRFAVKVLFRFLSFSRAELETRIFRILGNMIAFDVVLFLEELQNERGLVPDLEPLLASYRNGQSTAEEQEIERKYRIKMFEGVTDKAVKDIRNECIKTLKKLGS